MQEQPGPVGSMRVFSDGPFTAYRSGLTMDLPLDSGTNSSQLENNDKNLLSPVHVEKEGHVRVTGGMYERSS
ncbi:hypothetical protein EVAR_15798_1 [Eumeta japonica]|uniref:Uncharacterized protein n=1 Tax=Eumeta variegata TaxID=151549 RepID=A0A4C1TZP1_EUMVA|nr:hypothetical protein EVAR_15798_1 [Eumeta japonica]